MYPRRKPFQGVISSLNSHPHTWFSFCLPFPPKLFLCDCQNPVSSSAKTLILPASSLDILWLSSPNVAFPCSPQEWRLLSQAPSVKHCHLHGPQFSALWDPDYIHSHQVTLSTSAVIHGLPSHVLYLVETLAMTPSIPFHSKSCQQSGTCVMTMRHTWYLSVPWFHLWFPSLFCFNHPISWPPQARSSRNHKHLWTHDFLSS